MAAVEHDGAAVGEDLDHHRGHEVFRADRAGDAAVQRRRDLAQVGVFLGSVAEAAQYHPGQPDRVQALAAHVPDQQPHPVGGLQRLVEVPADRRLGAGRGVQHGQAQAPQRRGHAAQQRPLGDLGDPGDRAQPPFPLDAHPRHQRRQHGRGPDGDRGHPLPASRSTPTALP
jgi:hypothetical protein